MSSSVGYTSIKLSDENTAKLDALAAGAGVSRGRIAKLLLEELLPTVESVRTRLQITRVPQASEPPAPAALSAGTRSIRANHGTPFEQAGGR